MAWTDMHQYLSAGGSLTTISPCLRVIEAHPNMKPGKCNAWTLLSRREVRYERMCGGVFACAHVCGGAGGEGGGGCAGNCPADILVIFYTLPSVLLCVCRPVCRSVGRFSGGDGLQGQKALSPTYLAAGRGCDPFGCAD